MGKVKQRIQMTYVGEEEAVVNPILETEVILHMNKLASLGRNDLKSWLMQAAKNQLLIDSGRVAVANKLDGEEPASSPVEPQLQDALKSHTASELKTPVVSRDQKTIAPALKSRLSAM